MLKAEEGTTVRCIPCRRCGRKPEFHWNDVDTYNVYTISCPNCGIMKQQDFGTKLIEKAWNDRMIPLDEWVGDEWEYYK